MPGVRDRVVRVMLNDDEGGVNIRMSGEQIRRLADNYGRAAANEFEKKFARQGSPGWPEHRWVRFNRLLIALRDQLDGVGFAAGLSRHTPTLQQQLKEAAGKAPLRGPRRGQPGASEEPLSGAQLRELQSLLELLSISHRSPTGPVAASLTVPSRAPAFACAIRPEPVARSHGLGCSEAGRAMPPAGAPRSSVQPPLALCGSSLPMFGPA